MTMFGVERARHRRCLSLPSINGLNYAILLLFGAAFAQAFPSPAPLAHVEARHSAPSSWFLYTSRHTINVQTAGATCAGASVAATCLAFYWFCRMEKRFRHRLIMLLIFGDLMRSTWLFLFGVVSIASGTVFTQSSFCQASGFLIQYGTETSDYAVLVMAIHSALQVFRPSSHSRNDGLYHYRAFIYAGGFLVPILMSSLAFINPNWGYMSQGAFCSLPLRPFWYRLALAWIPRYLIATIILGLAVAIYAHVGFEFRAFSRAGQDGKPSISTTDPMLSACTMEEGMPASSNPPSITQGFSAQRRASSVVHDIVSSRPASAVTSSNGAITSLHTADLQELGAYSKSLPTSRRPSVTIASPTQRDHNPVSPTTVPPSMGKSKEYLSSLPDAAAYADSHAQPGNSNNVSQVSENPNNHIQRQLTHGRARIHKQLRLVFIYPLVYILMWLVPFINHCMTYKDQYAAHPVYWLSLFSTVCVTLMGCVDALIFTVRERPWRHIENSDGSFWGSFAMWRRGRYDTSKRSADSAADQLYMSTPRNGKEEAGKAQHKRTSVISGSLHSLTSLGAGLGLAGGKRNSKRSSRSDDHTKAVRDRARERLEFEREDRRRENAEKKEEAMLDAARRFDRERLGSVVSPREMAMMGSAIGPRDSDLIRETR